MRRLEGRRTEQVQREKISVLLPAYNEHNRLPSTLKSMVEFMRRGGDKYVDEIMVVDDGSTDNTVELALRYSGRLPLSIWRMGKNSGKWAAIHEGMRLARNDAILLLDADGSASITELERIGDDDLWMALRFKTCIFGSRFVRGASVSGKTVVRTLVSRVYRSYAKLVYFIACGRLSVVDDSQCPWKLVFKSGIKGRLVVDRWAGDIELICHLSGASVWNVPVDFVHVRGGTVKASTALSMFVDTLGVALRYRRENRLLKKRNV